MKVDVIADSISGVIRLTTVTIDMPCMFLSDLQAIREVSVTVRHLPTPRALIKAVEAYSFHPALPETVTPFGVRSTAYHWQQLRCDAIQKAKQLASVPEPPPMIFFERLLSPYAPIEVVATSAHWRCAIDQLRDRGEPDLAALATAIETALKGSRPRQLNAGDWHLPFTAVDDVDILIGQVVNDHGIHVLLTDYMDDLCHVLLRGLSVVRCLTTRRYTNIDTPERVKNDLGLFSSKFEELLRTRPDAYDHQASPDTIHQGCWRNANLHGNLTGWCQYRQIAKCEAWRRTSVST